LIGLLAIGDGRDASEMMLLFSGANHLATTASGHREDEIEDVEDNIYPRGQQRWCIDMELIGVALSIVQRRRG
jgi:hypothetical protein